MEIVPFITVPNGYMPCVACRDFKRFPGRMWLGYTRSGADETVTCPVCQGTGLVTRLRYVDPRTGEDIDPERLR